MSNVEPYLEHLNITVTNVENTIKFLQTAMPELKIRGGGQGIKTLEWVHLGTEKSYISIEDRGAREKGPHIPYKHPGLNHIGFVVANIEDLAKRMRQAGYREGEHNFEHPHRKRMYFFDDDDIEYEFVEYLSESSDQNNDYSL